MYLSELPGKNHGCRQGAIDGHKEIGKRCREMGVDTIIVFDTHWLVNSAYHINCADHFQGVYTSNELPHFIRDMTYDYDGNSGAGPAYRRRGGEARGACQSAQYSQPEAGVRHCADALHEQR